MADFWIRDEAGRVLGPIGLGVLRDLIAAGRLARIQAASREGVSFVPVAEVPEVADLVLQEARRQDDRMEAERIASLLHELKSRAPHEVFELREGASLDEFRAAFFRLAKHYHPDRLPPDALPELRLAYDSLFHFLAATMAAVETRLAAGAASPSAAPAGGAARARGYGPETFVGLIDRPDGERELEIHVSPATVGIFTENDLVNLAKDGVFMPLKGGLPLGSSVELRFVFDEPARTVQARGRVVFENVAGKRGKPGIGFKFVRLTEADRTFIAEYVRRVQDAADPRR